jgi:hypothetical protein
MLTASPYAVTQAPSLCSPREKRSAGRNMSFVRSGPKKESIDEKAFTCITSCSNCLASCVRWRQRRFEFAKLDNDTLDFEIADEYRGA